VWSFAAFPAEMDDVQSGMNALVPALLKGWPREPGII
jgi:hypothetical protein